MPSGKILELFQNLKTKPKTLVQRDGDRGSQAQLKGLEFIHFIPFSPFLYNLHIDTHATASSSFKSDFGCYICVLPFVSLPQYSWNHGMPSDKILQLVQNPKTKIAREMETEDPRPN